MKMQLIKKMIIRAGNFLAICAVFLGIWGGLRYLVMDDTSSYTRVMMHELYEQKNIDVLFCGASLCYRSFDTGILDEELGVNTFNSGTSSQPIDVTYYLLKDCLHRHDIKRVFVELGPIMAVQKAAEDRTSSDMTVVYLVSDYMKWSSAKVRMLIEASDSELYANSFLVARRGWRNVLDPHALVELLCKKRSDVYKNYQYDYLQHETEWYKGKGYVESIVKINEGEFCDKYSRNDISLTNISEDWYYYVSKIVGLCKDEGVELTLVCAPLSEYLIAAYGSAYDDFHNMVADIAQTAGIEFWNFSLVKDGYLRMSASDYADSAHLNMYGAQKFSHLIAQVANGELVYDDIACANIQQKLHEDDARVLGLISRDFEREIISNGEGILEYQIVFHPTEGEEYMIQDFSPNGKFAVPQGETGEICVTSRAGAGDAEQLYRYKY